MGLTKPYPNFACNNSDMKKLLFLLAILVAPFFAMAQAGKSPEFKWSETEHDFGKIKKGRTGYGRVQIHQHRQSPPVGNRREGFLRLHRS